VTGYRRRGASFAPAREAKHAERHIRARWSLPLFSTIATVAFVAVMLAEPTGIRAAWAEYGRDSVTAAPEETQSYQADGELPALTRDGFSTVKVAPPRPAAPAAGVPDPGTAQAIAYGMMAAYGWDDTEFNCLVALWNRESHWNVNAHNPRSGAHGIPQALPGEKMATVGADWATNPATQITWGLGYIAGRYGTPCGAWGHSEARGWY
jgi:hypothetical protein